MPGCGAEPAAAAAPEGGCFFCGAPLIPVPKQRTNARQLLQENLKSKPKPRGAAAGRGEGQEEADPGTGQGIAALGSAGWRQQPQIQVLNVTCPKEPRTSTWLP